MKYAFAGAALFAGVLAVPAWAPGTETVDVTTVETITSCGPEVTNCPAKSSSSETWVKPTWSDSWSDSWSSTSSSESWATSTASSTSSSSSSVVTSLTTPITTAPITTYPITTTTSVWTSPVTSSTSSVVTSPIVPVSSSTSTKTHVHSTGTAIPVSSGWAPHGTSSCGPGHPGCPGYSGTAPAGPKPTGSGTGVWSKPSPSSSPITPSTGGAVQNAAGLFAGIGAIVALFL